MIRPLGLELAAVLPARDVNGDQIRLVQREDILRLVAPIIRPKWSDHRSIRWLRDPGVGVRLTWDEEIARGNAELVADLNTKEGQDAYLECWWPAHMDGACIVFTADQAKDVPHPVWTQIRNASVILRLSPTMAFQTYRWGATTVTTTRGRALWDVGIRRELWHPSNGFYKYLEDNAATARLTPLDDADPLRVWTYAPTHPERRALAFYCERQDRPITDNAMDWLKGTP
jgi:hypothetical protein